MALKTILAVAAGLAVLVGSFFAYRTWARAKAGAQVTHPDAILGHANGKANDPLRARR